VAENSKKAAHLAPYCFKPGQTGNAGGRPKKHPVTGYLKDQLDKPIPEKMKAKLPPIFVEVYGENATFGEMIAFKLVAMSAKGDIIALKELLDRVEGKVAQKTVHTGEDDGPILVEVQDVRSKLSDRLAGSATQPAAS
jgi:hypothetical protein